MTSIRSASVIFLFISTIAAAQQQAARRNEAQGRISKQAQPSGYQLAWQRQEFYLFFHFGPNSFTDKEWGEGTESENIFNTSSPDCRQWCRVAKLAGATGV